MGNSGEFWTHKAFWQGHWQGSRKWVNIVGGNYLAMEGPQFSTLAESEL